MQSERMRFRAPTANRFAARPQRIGETMSYEEEMQAEDGARFDYISEAYGPSAIDGELESMSEDWSHLCDDKGAPLEYSPWETREEYRAHCEARSADYHASATQRTMHEQGFNGNRYQ